MEFEWDAKKAESNVAKHGVTFLDMNHHVQQSHNDEMRPEYDFSHGVRGKHYEAYRAGTNVVFLDPDVAKAFADSASVNQALRLLLQLARTNVSLDRQPAKTAPPSDRAPRQEAQARSRQSRVDATGSLEFGICCWG